METSHLLHIDIFYVDYRNLRIILDWTVQFNVSVMHDVILRDMGVSAYFVGHITITKAAMSKPYSGFPQISEAAHVLSICLLWPSVLDMEEAVVPLAWSLKKSR